MPRLHKTEIIPHGVTVGRKRKRSKEDKGESRSRPCRSDKIFGTSGDQLNLKSQYAACSYNALQFVSKKDSRATNGVYEVRIDMSVSGLSQLAAELGPLNGQFDHVMLCLPPGTTGNLIAFAYIHHWLSVYNDEWCNYLPSQVHGIGHNLNLAHSGETGSYDDLSSVVSLTACLLL